MKQKNNFRFHYLVLFVTLLLLFGFNTHAAKAAEAETTGGKQGDPQVNWLFVMTGTSGSFDGKTITLHNVPPTLMFSDRPYRIFGHMDTAKLIKEVSTGPNSFAEDPPNAVLSTFGGELPTTATVVLYKPTLTGKTLSFPVKVSEGNIPRTFEGATLFIDHWHRHPHIGAFVVGAAVGSAVHHASQPKTVVVQQPAYYYQATPPPPPPAPAPDSTKSPEARLGELKSMYDKGLITKSDYDQKKKQILNQM
jgi:hypothetical protein